MMEKTELTLYLGGTRSGKSARAEAQALRTGGPVLYVATAEARPDDPSMHERIRRHRDRRPPHWSTLSALCILRSGSPHVPGLFLEAAASVSPSNLQNPAWAALQGCRGSRPGKADNPDRLRNAVGVEHTVRPAGTGGSDGSKPPYARK
ncbi:MAG: bifunctional adenosylcobinamide kinase/adenosylcobinamide-phosphate guanylyltransferase [Bilophila wadsworthia]